MISDITNKKEYCEVCGTSGVELFTTNIPFIIDTGKTKNQDGTPYTVTYCRMCNMTRAINDYIYKQMHDSVCPADLSRTLNYMLKEIQGKPVVVNPDWEGILDRIKKSPRDLGLYANELGWQLVEVTRMSPSKGNLPRRTIKILAFDYKGISEKLTEMGV